MLSRSSVESDPLSASSERTSQNDDRTNTKNVDPSFIGLTTNHQQHMETIRQQAARLLIDDSIELNVGGNIYVTSGWVLAREHTSWLANHLDSMTTIDSRGRYFIDRDGKLFQHILQYLQVGELRLPKDFKELHCLRREAVFYGLKVMTRMVDKLLEHKPELYKGKYITLTEHATYNIRIRDNVKIVFKRISSITVAGHVSTCRRVFGTNLSLDRDSHDNQDRYSCRMVIVQGSETQVFDQLQRHGYKIVVNNKTDAATLGKIRSEYKQEQSKRWIHVTNYFFLKSNQPLL